MKWIVQKWLNSFCKSVSSHKNKEKNFGLEKREKKQVLKKQKQKQLEELYVHKLNKASNILELNPEKTETFLKAFFTPTELL